MADPGKLRGQAAGFYAARKLVEETEDGASEIAGAILRVGETIAEGFAEVLDALEAIRMEIPTE